MSDARVSPILPEESSSGLFESYAQLNQPFSWARLRWRLFGAFGIHALLVALLVTIFYYSVPEVPDGRLVAMVPLTL